MNIDRMQGMALMLIASVSVSAALIGSRADAFSLSSGAQPAGECLQPTDVLRSFFRVVEEGDLVLFGQTVTAKQLRPMRVEFAHELGSGVRSVNVHAELLAPIPVPGSAGMVAQRVAVVMGSEGRIVETRAHVVMR